MNTRLFRSKVNNGKVPFMRSSRMLAKNNMLQDINDRTMNTPQSQYMPRKVSKFFFFNYSLSF